MYNIKNYYELIGTLLIISSTWMNYSMPELSTEYIKYSHTYIHVRGKVQNLKMKV